MFPALATNIRNNPLRWQVALDSRGYTFWGGSVTLSPEEVSTGQMFELKPATRSITASMILGGILLQSGHLKVFGIISVDCTFLKKELNCKLLRG